MRAVVLCTLLAVASANPLRAAMRHMQQMGGPGMEINEEQIKAQVVQTLQKIPLFKSVPAEGIQEFFTILFNQELARREVYTNLDAWAQKYSVQASWEMFKNSYLQAKTKFNAAFTSVLSKLSPVWQKIVEIEEDDSRNLINQTQDMGAALEPIGTEFAQAVGEFFKTTLGEETLKALGGAGEENGSGLSPFPETGVSALPWGPVGQGAFGGQGQGQNNGQFGGQGQNNGQFGRQGQNNGQFGGQGQNNGQFGGQGQGQFGSNGQGQGRGQFGGQGQFGGSSGSNGNFPSFPFAIPANQ